MGHEGRCNRARRRAGSWPLSGDAVGSEAGLNEATITPSDSGEVTLIIDTDLFNWKVKLLPMRIAAAGESVPRMPLNERGRHLFAAKGCATCHAKHDDPAFVDWNLVQAGPDLTGRTYQDEWLAAKLADPSQSRGVYTNGMVMPRLELEPSETAALVSYIDGSHVAETGGQ